MQIIRLDQSTGTNPLNFHGNRWHHQISILVTGWAISWKWHHNLAADVFALMCIILIGLAFFWIYQSRNVNIRLIASHACLDSTSRLRVFQSFPIAVCCRRKKDAILILIFTRALFYFASTYFNKFPIPHNFCTRNNAPLLTLHSSFPMSYHGI